MADQTSLGEAHAKRIRQQVDPIQARLAIQKVTRIRYRMSPADPTHVELLDDVKMLRAALPRHILEAARRHLLDVYAGESEDEEDEE